MKAKERKRLLKDLNKNRAAFGMHKLNAIPEWMMLGRKTK